MRSQVALIFGSLTVSPVTRVPSIIVTLAHEAILEIGANGVHVTIVCHERALVNQHLALVSIANKTVWTSAVVTSRDIGTNGITVTTMCAKCAFVDFGNTRDSVAIKTWFTLTSVSRIGLAISGFLGNAVGVGRALMITIIAVVWLVARTLAQCLKVSQEFCSPTGRTLRRHLIDERLNLVDPLACDADITIIIVIMVIIDADPKWANKSASNVTRHSITLVAAKIIGSLTKTC